MTYCCPDPTPEQLALAKDLGFDPYDRCGDGFTDTSPCDVLCAACLIHDEMFLIGGTIQDFHLVNANFARDCLILAQSQNDYFSKMNAAFRALEYIAIIHTASWQFWHFKDRNTDITRAQGVLFMLDAKAWINECALRIGTCLPYPEVA